MQYYIQKITTSTDGSVDVEKVKLGGLDLFPHYNHAFYELSKLDKTIKFNENQLYVIDGAIYQVLPYLGDKENKFTDKRSREWEIFQDLAYYDMICVRTVDNRDFNSPLSFHFNTYTDAYLFAYLLKNCS